MKKQLTITWEGVKDSTGFLFSFAKALSAAIRNSSYFEKAEDIVATSGMAFRMWLREDLCPSALSTWNLDDQKVWVENGGLSCKYVGRYWEQEAIEEEKRLEAIQNIKESIDKDIAAIVWDIGVPEWGLITGYDDEKQVFYTLAINEFPQDGERQYSEMPYEMLGKREIPMLSVLTITGETDKAQEEILKDTMKIAVNHLRGREWCDDSISGLEVYPKLINKFKDHSEEVNGWNMEYHIQTYCALKEYIYLFFDKTKETKLAKLYKAVFDAWTKISCIKTNEDISILENREKVITLLEDAYKNEQEAAKIMEERIGSF